MWLRILDVARTLAARTYAVTGRLVLEVHDSFLGRGGRFVLDGGPDGATCAPTEREPELSLGVGTLGAAYLGANACTTLHAAGLIDEHRPGAVALASAMFAAERPAHCGTDF
jgi:predicted acetyltransferase